MRNFIIAVGCCLLVVALSGCAVGSATAGYSASAGSADDLKTAARSRIVDDAVSSAKAYTDAEIAKLRAELNLKR